ncbi:hypothetical protein CDAR_488371 [Caerostris darwini]|uniref:Uncharacterized protein n=1 Tax=Caerostris darwini TaxID=1538125 RepID=A0AAV4PXK8_9ARAC|nr:hypothetical protein CDAR_488371 [Caerostris darwini]
MMFNYWKSFSRIIVYFLRTAKPQSSKSSAERSFHSPRADDFVTANPQNLVCSRLSKPPLEGGKEVLNFPCLYLESPLHATLRTPFVLFHPPPHPHPLELFF